MCLFTGHYRTVLFRKGRVIIALNPPLMPGMGVFGCIGVEKYCLRVTAAASGRNTRPNLPLGAWLFTLHRLFELTSG